MGEFLDTRVDQNLCPNSVDYTDHVWQFSCHQGLSEAEADWVREWLVPALDQAVAGVSP